MSIQQNDVNSLIRRMEHILENSFPILPNILVVVKQKEFEDILEVLYASIPNEIKEAKRILRRKEELQIEAEQRANKIIDDANNEAARLLSESELLRKVQNEAVLIKEQVIAECEEIKRKALEDAENYRNQAHDDAIRTKEGAETYAEQVLASLENTLVQHQQLVKNGQIYMEKLRAESNSNYDSLQQNYTQEQQLFNNNDFKIE